MAVAVLHLHVLSDDAGHVTLDAAPCRCTCGPTGGLRRRRPPFALPAAVAGAALGVDQFFLDGAAVLLQVSDSSRAPHEPDQFVDDAVQVFGGCPSLFGTRLFPPSRAPMHVRACVRTGLLFPHPRAWARTRTRGRCRNHFPTHARAGARTRMRCVRIIPHSRAHLRYLSPWSLLLVLGRAVRIRRALRCFAQ